MWKGGEALPAAPRRPAQSRGHLRREPCVKTLSPRLHAAPSARAESRHGPAEKELPGHTCPRNHVPIFVRNDSELLWLFLTLTVFGPLLVYSFWTYLN